MNHTGDDYQELFFQDLETQSVTESFADYALDEDYGEVYDVDAKAESNHSDAEFVLVPDQDKLSTFRALIVKDKTGKPLSKKDKKKAAGKNRNSESGPGNATAMFNPDLFQGDIIGAKVEHQKESKNRNAAANSLMKVGDRHSTDLGSVL